MNTSRDPISESQFNAETEPGQNDLLEQILTAEVLTFARVIKLDTTIMDESSAARDFREEAIKEIKRNRSEVIAKLTQP